MLSNTSHPQEIADLIERLMFEDLSSITLGPGMPPRGLNSKAWVEHRSRVTAHKTGAHAAWGVAGVLDSLIAGQGQKARAGCGVLLMMFDQAGIDRGQWNLASELSLEPPWAELALAHLKDQEDYLAKRRNIGKDARTPEEGPQKIRAMPSQRDEHAQRPSQKHSSAGTAQQG